MDVGLEVILPVCVKNFQKVLKDICNSLASKYLPIVENLCFHILKIFQTE